MTAEEWGIPILDLAMQATEIVRPARKWGTTSRSARMEGTYFFYANDYIWHRLAFDPGQLPRTGCRCAVEPNFSTHEDLPRAKVLHDIQQKRWIARQWQKAGVRIFVDLNVEPCFRDLALLGVPYGWRAYATRKHRDVRLSELEADWRMAVKHADTEDVLFAVFGGGQRVKKMCGDRGWEWCPEHRDVVKKAVAVG